ncbi:MAG TPA: hypothetical protein VF736_10000 [Pyrinomonadaceae bacterium]|jgi:hypothetical protein
MKRKFFALAVAAALLGNALTAFAQERERSKIVIAPNVEEDEILVAQQGPPGMPPQVEIRGDNLIFMATEMSFAGKLVKGAPYSAQAVTESVQQLTDGNRIVRKNTAQVYRDSEGRTRRDQALSHIGPFATSGDTPQTVFINDPVAGVNYILDPNTRTARKLPRVELRFKVEGDAAQAREREAKGLAQKFEIERTFTRVPGPDGPGQSVVIAPPAPPDGGVRTEFFSTTRTKPDVKTENLEPRSFEGVQAEGKRTTTTIAAGEIGNEQPIQIVDEYWYSPELQVVVMTRHSDPRSGENTYRLTNISRAEPAAALFQVPSDYTVKDTTAPTGVRRMRRPAPPPPAPPAPQEN